jgi:lysophospholipase L1-like esterase
MQRGLRGRKRALGFFAVRTPASLWVFSVPLGLASAAAVLLATGLAVALSGPWGEALAQPVSAQKPASPVEGAQTIVVLGDSISDGTGDPLGGYAARTLGRLREQGRDVRLANFAIGGSETSDVLKVIEEERVKAELARADWVLLSAAGNDLSHALRGGREGALGSGMRDTALALEQARGNLERLVRRLRELSPRASVRVLGLYNPLEVSQGSEGSARRMLLDWNIAIHEAALEDSQTLVVPIADLFEGRPERLSKDRYHPGASGHAAIAERVLATLD